MPEDLLGPLTIRIWVDGQMTFKALYESASSADMQRIGAEHAGMLQSEQRPWMVEIEVMDDPSEERFLRFGTDERGMVDPIALD